LKAYKGSIGKCVIEIAKGFRMDVLASDVRPDQDLASRLRFRYMEMDQLLASSDIITLHVPSNENTRNLISDEEFARMIQGVVLINTARGDVLDIKALAKAIGEGKVAAAGLDVLPEEGGIREEAELLRSVYDQKHDLETMLLNHILLRLRNVVITPHSAFNTRDAVERILSTSVGNIASFTQGELENVISGKRA
jgi:D-lactate dehydrogenase